MNLRLLSAQIIDAVTKGHSLTSCLEEKLTQIKNGRDKAFLQALCYGVCRRYPYLDIVLSCLLKKAMQAKDSDVHALLLVGLYQLIYMRVPPHAAVAETVNAVAKFNKPWARGFINAVLREYLRTKERIEEKIKLDEEAVYAHPQWWITAIKTAWPLHGAAILMANNLHPPFALRVNQQMITREKYIKILQEQDKQARLIPETNHGIILDDPILAEELPGFASGMVSVQDGAAQLAAEILDLAPNQRVLDACAAPGGKLLHILESEPGLASCTAVEKDSRRMHLLSENLLRAKRSVQCFCADVRHDWWDGQLFDRILLDAPCSASGVIRRHPDIKLLRQPSDITALAKEQRSLLASLWPLLKKGGMLLYSTCSIFPEENVDVMQAFFADHRDAKEVVLDVEWGIACKIGRQLLPDIMDGFYYARISKM